MIFQLFTEHELIYEDDDIQYQIEELGGEEYLVRLLTVIKDEKEQEIGEMAGYLLFPDEIFSDMRDSFLVMDAISQLLCNAHGYMVENKKTLIDKECILYLNRLTLYKEHYNNELEEQVLAFLLDTYETVIYSLGSTELTDKDFSEHQDENYIKHWRAYFKKGGWKYNRIFNLHFKSLLKDNVKG